MNSANLTPRGDALKVRAPLPLRLNATYLDHHRSLLRVGKEGVLRRRQEIPEFNQVREKGHLLGVGPTTLIERDRRVRAAIDDPTFPIPAALLLPALPVLPPVLLLHPKTKATLTVIQLGKIGKEVDVGKTTVMMIKDQVRADLKEVPLAARAQEGLSGVPQPLRRGRTARALT